MKPGQRAKLKGISYKTAWRMWRDGRLPVHAEQLPTGTVVIHLPEEEIGGVALYARVSSADQKADLERQLFRLTDFAASQKMLVVDSVTEIASGMDGHRKGLTRLLSNPDVKVVLVEHRDRMARFGFEYIDAALSAQGRKIVVVDADEVRDDIVRDLHEVIVSMCARLYGKRSARHRALKGLCRQCMSEHLIFTYQTRLALADGPVLDAYASLHGRVERSLFAAWRAGQQMGELKSEFQTRFGITARQFNAVRVGLEGKISSIRERRPDLIAECQTRIKRTERIIKRLECSAEGSNKLHQKRRRLQTLFHRLEAMKAEHQQGSVSVCFGSRKLFRAQFDLRANGYGSHEAWRKDWESARGRQFFVLGSQDETAGNQTCQATLAADGSLTLRLRLPDSLIKDSKFLVIPGVRFAYGHDALVAALASSRTVQVKTTDGKAGGKRIGTAISYRFLRDEKGWRVFASVEAQPVAVVSRRPMGAIGVDVNADHLAVAETDRYGNLIGHQRIELPLDGKTADQKLALIGDAAVAIAKKASAAGKPVVIEQLDFQKKKAELESVDPARARRVSSFACGKVASSIKAACFRSGIEVIEVNPAYTSVIGAVQYARRRGISVHMGAAYAIARRGLGLSERPTMRQAVTPVRNGGHVTFDLPARNRSKHVWSFWSTVRTRLGAAHREHYRSGAHRVAPPPLRRASPALGASGSITAQPRDANRFPYCSGSVLEDVPC